MRLLKPLKGNSKKIFIFAAGLLILNNIAAGLAAFTDMVTLGEALKEIFQALGYGTAFVGGLALFTTRLSKAGTWLPRIAAFLEGLGVIGTAILAIGAILTSVSMVTLPEWTSALGIGVLLGQVGLALLGFAALRTKALPTGASLSLLTPLLAFIIFIVGAGLLGEDGVPAYVPFLNVTLQTLAHLAIAITIPGEPSSAEESPFIEPSPAQT